MADNVVLNSGTGGATLATDEIPVTLEHYQYVKLADGVANSTAKIGGDAANGLDVDVTRLPALVAGTANIGDVDVLTLPALPAGTNNIGDVDVLTQPDLSSEHTRNEAFTQAVAVGGELDDTAPVVATEGNVSPVRITAQRAAHANLRNNAGTEVGTSTDPVRVDPTGITTQPVSGTVTANLAAGTNNIGDVDVLTLPNVTLAAGTNTNEVVGDVAHDAGAAGNPVLVCGVAQDVDDTAPPNRVSAESDATRIATDRDGSIFVHPHGPQIWSYHENSSSALTDASVHAAPGVGLSLYVTDIVVSTGAATAFNVFFEEGVTTVLGPYYLEAVAGRGLAIHFTTPKKITANTALTITTSAAIAHGIDVTGFVAQG